jgi:hypothetical protein
MIEPMDDQVGEQALQGAELEAAIKKFDEAMATADQAAPPKPTAPSPELEAAAAKFKEAFAERSFSQRNEDLGKMINCHLCGFRHREADPIARLSRAHGEQKFGDVVIPSRHVLFAKKRFNPHRNSKVLQFVRLTEKIYNEDIAPYFAPDPEHPDNLIRRAQRQAAKIMRRIWIAQRVVLKHMQDQSRRINVGLELPGSRYSHPVRDRKQS